MKSVGPIIIFIYSGLCFWAAITLGLEFSVGLKIIAAVWISLALLIAALPALGNLADDINKSRHRNMDKN